MSRIDILRASKCHFEHFAIGGSELAPGHLGQQVSAAQNVPRTFGPRGAGTQNILKYIWEGSKDVSTMCTQNVFKTILRGSKCPRWDSHSRPPKMFSK